MEAYETNPYPDTEARAQFLARAKALAPTKAILDIGAGYGALLMDLQGLQPVRRVGLEYVADVVEKANRDSNDHGVEMRVGDMMCIPQEHPDLAQAFDLICSQLAVHYSEDLPALAESIKFALAPGGRVLLMMNVCVPPFPALLEEDRVVEMTIGPDLVLENQIYPSEMYIEAFRGVGLQPASFQGSPMITYISANHKVLRAGANERLFGTDGKSCLDVQVMIVEFVEV